MADYLVLEDFAAGAVRIPAGTVISDQFYTLATLRASGLLDMPYTADLAPVIAAFRAQRSANPDGSIDLATAILRTARSASLVGLDQTLPLAQEYTGLDQPAAPELGVVLFARSRAGRRQLNVLGPVGAPQPMQPSLGQRRCGFLQARGDSTSIDGYGFFSSATGTATSRTTTPGGALLASLKRLGYVSAAGAGSSAGTRHNDLQWFRGAGGQGGFFMLYRFGVAAVTPGMRWAVGLVNPAGVIGNVDPSTLNDSVFIGCDAADTTVQVMHNDNAGACTKVDLGANFPAKTADAIYEVRIFCAPSGTTIGVFVQRIDVAAFAEVTLSANLPVAATKMSPQLWANNGADAVAVALDFMTAYIETDL